MAYILVENFRQGQVRTTERVVGPPGSVWKLENGHLTRGGEIERCKRFVSKYTTALSSTKGLATAGGLLYVFGEGADPGVQSGLTYQRLQHATPGSSTVSKILDWGVFAGKLYVVAEFADGNVYHYYNGSRVTDWDTIAASVASNNNVASALATKVDASPDVSASAASAVVTITAATAGTDFTIAASTVNGGSNTNQTLTLNTTVANVAAVSAVAATATFRITGGTASAGVNEVQSVKVDGVEIMDTDVDWATSNSATATAVAAQINTYSSSPNYTAAAVGDMVTITHPTAGATPNGFVLSVTVAGDVTVANLTNMAGGVTAVSAVAKVVEATVGGTFETLDTFTLTINGIDYVVSGQASGTGRTVFIFKGKVYSSVGSLVYFSDLNAPASWIGTGGAVGHGNLNMSQQNGVSEDVVSLVAYQTYVAVCGRNNIRIQHFAEDPADNAFIQTLENTGTIAQESVISYGANDVFYLADSGIRSLRARDSSNAASVNDIGNAIDNFVADHLAGLTDAQIAAARAVIEPRDGRLMISVNNRIYVFSYYPQSKVAAWSYYLPGFTVDEMVRVGKVTYLRGTNTIYTYGGDAGTTYPSADEFVCTIELPFLDGKTPATKKTFTGFDFAATNFWTVSILIDPTNETNEVAVGVLGGITYNAGMVAGSYETTHVAPKLVCSRAGRATISSLAVVHEPVDAD